MAILQKGNGKGQNILTDEEMMPRMEGQKKGWDVEWENSWTKWLAR